MGGGGVVVGGWVGGVGGGGWVGGWAGGGGGVCVCVCVCVCVWVGRRVVVHTPVSVFDVWRCFELGAWSVDPGHRHTSLQNRYKRFIKIL